MIQKESVLKVIDNTGVGFVKCFTMYKCGSFASIGDLIKVSVLTTKPTSKVTKGTVCKAVVVRTKNKLIRSDRSSIAFNENAVVLLNDKNEPIGTRIKGVVPREISSNLRAMALGVI